MVSLAKSSELEKKILIKQQKEINKIYLHSYENLKKEIKNLEGRTNISSILKTQEMEKLKTKIAKEYKNSTALVKEAVNDNMETISKSVVEDNLGFLKEVGFSVDAAFMHVPRDVVKSISLGQVYDSNWSLSKALWSDDKKKLHEINQIIAEGVTQGKGSYDLAKDLEKYVNPKAKKPWDWGKVYPGVRKKIDYNAQRLARTLVHHAYQQSVIETSKPNPFIEGIQWLSAYSHRTCDLCISRAEDDKYGLGAGIFPKDEVPLDHPNGLCTLASVVLDSYEDIATRIRDWSEGKEDKDLDAYANALYETDIYGKESPLKGIDKDTIDHLEEKYANADMLDLKMQIDDIQWNVDNNYSTTKYGIQYEKDKLQFLKWKKEQMEQKQKVVTTVKPVSAKSKKQATSINGKSADEIEKMLNYQYTNLTDKQDEWSAIMRRWKDKLPYDEYDAVVKYTGSYYSEMNSYLRTDGKDNKSFATLVENAAKALGKVETEEELSVRRGVSITGFAGMFDEYDIAKGLRNNNSTNWVEKNLNSLVGRVASDKGFLSTSTSKYGGFSNDVNLKIELPTGTKGAYIDDISSHHGEKEFLIQKGYSYEVTDVKLVNGKDIVSEKGEKYVVYLKLILDK